MKIIKYSLVSFLVIALMASMVARSDNEEFVRFKLGSHSVEIPKANTPEQGFPAWLSWLPGLDNSTDQVIFVISAEDIANSIDGYRKSDGNYQEDVRGLLVALTSHEAVSYTSSSAYEDLWHATGSYSKRRVERFGDRLFKVYRESEYPFSWALLSQNPEEEKAVPAKASDFWLAHCLSGKSSATSSGEHVICKSHIVVDDLLIEFNISEKNLAVLGQLKGLLVDRVQDWVKS